MGFELIAGTQEVKPITLLQNGITQYPSTQNTSNSLPSLGRTFSRSYLQETIWNTLYIEGDRSVDNAMLRIRKKLGTLGAKIETMRGIGYRLRRAEWEK